MTESPADTAPSPEETLAAARLAARQRWIIVGLIVAFIAILAMLVMAVYGLLQNGELTAQIRDIFIIFMAFESLVIGVALIILIVQIASLINLVQNEIRPILEATNETINTLRGTTAFLSENLVEPVIKLNSTLAGIRRFFELFGFKRK